MKEDIALSLSPYSVESILDKFEIMNLSAVSIPEIYVEDDAKCWYYDWVLGLRPMVKHKVDNTTMACLNFDMISWQHLVTGCMTLIGCQMKLKSEGKDSTLLLFTRDFEETAICLIEGNNEYS